MISDFRPDGGGTGYFGVYPAIVTDILKDGQNLGRIEVRFPFLGEAGKNVRALATLCTPYADDGQGFQMIPAEKSQVVVAFEAGDLRRPYILGACWNGQEAQPDTPVKANNKRLIKTRSGNLLEFDDTDGSPKVTLSMKSGHKVVMDDGANTVTVSHSNGSSLEFQASGDVAVNATGRFVVTASSVQVNAPSTTHSGNVTCMAHTATSISSPLYSQGAGNIW
jgi:uncharacterized protein involved in type VI secretion and phage assembly